ncbi:hypothetical protein [Rhodoferax sp. UBA5149]|uniref:hypothetical protein n=1 Tax=Rhodoferax sp. UBA5149 TaxID=1947379 RepID=UPI0025FA90AC|nr:hypothetical protein [Rhodoferax sp. UBA5149]
MNVLNRGVLLGLLCVAALTGCGGGDNVTAGTPAASTLSGVAAVGFPIVGGAVNVTCAGGSALTSPTSSTGAWQVTVSGQTLPCAVQVSGGTVNGAANSTKYHSIATSLGTVNITPLTDLLVANLSRAIPSAWFASLNSAALTPINAAAVGAALTQLRTALALTQLSGIDPITLAFTAASGNLIDDMLAALQTAMTNAGVSYATLLSAATGSTFTPPSGMSTAFASAFSGTTSGGTAGGGSGSGGVGCTGQVATLFSNAKGSYSAAAMTFDNAAFGTTPTSPVAGFVNGVNSNITVNADCTITVGAFTLTYKSGSYAEFPSGADTQYNIDLTGVGVKDPHFELFTGKRSLTLFDTVNTSQGVSFDEK